MPAMGCLCIDCLAIHPKPATRFMLCLSHSQPSVAAASPLLHHLATATTGVAGLPPGLIPHQPHHLPPAAQLVAQPGAAGPAAQLVAQYPATADHLTSLAIASSPLLGGGKKRPREPGDDQGLVLVLMPLPLSSHFYCSLTSV